MTVYTPGMRIQCRDAEWLVTRVGIANQHHDQMVYCRGTNPENHLRMIGALRCANTPYGG